MIRTGLEIETEASEKYVIKVMAKLMEIIREFNRQEADNAEPKDSRD